MTWAPAFSVGNQGAITLGDWHQAAASGGYDTLRFVPWGLLDPFFAAVVEATEEAVAHALVAGEDMVGRDGHRCPGLPRDRVAELFRDRRP